MGWTDASWSILGFTRKLQWILFSKALPTSSWGLSFTLNNQFLVFLWFGLLLLLLDRFFDLYFSLIDFIYCSTLLCCSFIYSSTLVESISTLYFLVLSPNTIISFFYSAIGLNGSNLNVWFSLVMVVPFDDPKSTIIKLRSKLK